MIADINLNVTTVTVTMQRRWPVWPSPALLPHAAEFRLPGPLMPDATLLVHTLALPSSRAKLIHMRAFESCGMYIMTRIVLCIRKIGRREIPEEIYPTCLERSGMG